MDLEAIFGEGVAAPEPSVPLEGGPVKTSGPQDSGADEARFERFVCQVIECSMGLPVGSLTLWTPTRRPGGGRA
jgi:hypothetical protein